MAPRAWFAASGEPLAAICSNLQRMSPPLFWGCCKSLWTHASWPVVGAVAARVLAQHDHLAATIENTSSASPLALMVLAAVMVLP